MRRRHPVPGGHRRHRDRHRPVVDGVDSVNAPAVPGRVLERVLDRAMAAVGRVHTDDHLVAFVLVAPDDDHRARRVAAVVIAAGHVNAPDEDDRLYDQLDRRHTVWTPFAHEPVPVDLEVELADVIRHEGATPRWLLRAGTRRIVTDLARRAAADRTEDPGHRMEAVRWPTAIPSPEPAPTLLALCTPNDHRADWLRAGQALHHALLVASAAGIAGSFLSPVIEIPLLRRQLLREVDLPGCPQVLLALGRAQELFPSPSPRRPVADVVSN